METLGNDLGTVLDQLNTGMDRVPTSQAMVHEDLLLLQNYEQRLIQELGRIVSRRSQLIHLSIGFAKAKVTLDSLPPELLIQVFLHATFVDKRQPYWYLNPSLEWSPVAISHVCRRWRSLALGTSSLWATIFPRNSSALLVFLKRSSHQDVGLVWKDVPSRLVHSRFARFAHGGTCERTCSIVWVDRLQANSPVHVLLSRGSFRNLRELILHRDSRKSHDESANFTMSSLSILLNQLPDLEEFTLNGYLPVMDVILSKCAEPDQPGRTAVTMVPVILSHLHSFTWDSAPTRALRRFFCITNMPNLRSLNLSAIKISDGHSWASKTTAGNAATGVHDFSSYSLPLVYRFDYLRRLSLSCEDSTAFTLAYKLDFPLLEELSLTCSRISKSPVLPHPQTIFREPRLVKLTQLELIDLDLDLENTTAILSYLQSLESLAINACRGTGAVVCSLSRNACCERQNERFTRWLCPSLNELRISSSSGTKFRCLETAIRVRKTHSEITTSQSNRIIKPLKKSLLEGSISADGVSGFAGNGLPATPVKARRGLSDESFVSSPNGSLVSRWRGHDMMRPCKIQTVCVADCMRISEVELLSLQEGSYGVVSVLWTA